MRKFSFLIFLICFFAFTVSAAADSEDFESDFLDSIEPDVEVESIEPEEVIENVPTAESDFETDNKQSDIKSADPQDEKTRGEGEQEVSEPEQQADPEPIDYSESLQQISDKLDALIDNLRSLILGIFVCTGILIGFFVVDRMLT